MGTIGWYYLHTNNELIYKSDSEAIADIRESDFARAAWPIDPSDREGAWNLLVEALSLGAKKERVLELAKKWGCDNEDAESYAERVGVVLELDGNAWCAHRKDFENLQESPAGFGDTKLEAMAELCHTLEYKADKLGWGATFKDLLMAHPKKRER